MDAVQDSPAVEGHAGLSEIASLLDCRRCRHPILTIHYKATDRRQLKFSVVGCQVES